MFTKASERQCLALVVGKMSASVKVSRRRELRIQHRMNVRRAMFVSAYVHTKYCDIYSEANDFFDALDKRYPGKRDLTKTVEYMAWKKNTSTTVKNQEPSTKRAKSQEPSTKRAKTQEPSTKRAKTQEPSTKRAKTQEPSTKRVKTQEPSTKRAKTQEPSTDMNNFELRIPLLGHKARTLDEGTTDHICPSILEEISPELFTQLVPELQADPALDKIFHDVQQEDLELEYPELELDIDIESSPLEIELALR